jgi:hypothetical protein
VGITITLPWDCVFNDSAELVQYDVSEQYSYVRIREACR